MENLRTYYAGLKRGGKKAFCLSVASELQMSASSVMNWCSGWCKPSDKRSLEVLSKHSGIDVEHLY